MSILNTDEKRGVVYRQWVAPSPKIVLLLVHGLGGHSGRWEFLAQLLLENGISSYAIELKGFGETKDLLGHIDSFRIYFEDIRAVRNIISVQHPRAKIFLLGESMGGLLAFLLAITDPRLFSGLICISPAFKSRLKFDNAKVFLSLIFNTRKQFAVPFDSRMCTRDTRHQMVMDHDLREHRLASAKLLVNIFTAQMRAGSLKKKLTIPVLFLLAGDDFLVDPDASVNVFRGLSVKDKLMIRYPGMRHALSIELGREKVFQDILQWIQDRAV